MPYGDAVIPLQTATLSRVAAAGIPVPTYSRDAVVPGIVHIGVGGFHRAHQAMYLDTLLAAGRAADWGICGVGVRAEDRRMHEVLKAQDCLYTLMAKHPDGRVEPRVVGSIVDFLWAPEDPGAVVERIATPTTRVVSLTVTQHGYALDPDVADCGPPPLTALGILTEALRRRHARGTGPVTVLSCDNLRGNGDVARRSLTGWAARRDPDLADWIEAEVAFPNSVVDRITPATTPDDVALLAAGWGVADAWPVVCEPFTQWVVEDRFAAGRPPIEEAGALLVDDAEPYEQMKLGLLNGGHQALAYLGALSGHRYVHEAFRDPLLARFVRQYLDREVTPTLRPVPGVDLEDYTRDLCRRFASEGIADTVARLCDPTPTMIAKYVLPVVRTRLRARQEIRCAAAVVSGWARFREASDGDAHAPPMSPVSHLADPAFDMVRSDPLFTGPYLDALTELRQGGPGAVLERLLAEPHHRRGRPEPGTMPR